MAIDTSKFDQLFEHLLDINLSGAAPPPPPFKMPPTVASIQAALDLGRSHLPVIFRDAYVAPLEKNLATVVQMLKASELILETVTAAVYDHAHPDVAPQLRRFLAVVSDFYRSFLSAKRRARASFPLVEQLPPLAMFQSNGQQGPFTVPVNDIRRLCDAKIGIVSLPSTYRDHPALWATLAHETGGHDVLHADPELLPELKAGVAAVLGDGPGGPFHTAKLMAALWAYWMDEAASDVYGVLNLGPSYGLNLAVYFSALNAERDKSRTPKLDTRSHFARHDPQRALDAHPTDILRPYLILGAVESLTKLAQETRDAYTADLIKLAEYLAHGAQTVSLQGYILGGPGVHSWVETSLNITEMQNLARRVGSYIATARLNAYGGRNIQDLETWDDADQHSTERIAAALANGDSVTGMGDDAQLLSGATLALYERPDLYRHVTDLVEAALDFSYDDDPLWGKARLRPIFLRPVPAGTELPPPSSDDAGTPQSVAEEPVAKKAEKQIDNRKAKGKRQKAKTTKMGRR